MKMYCLMKGDLRFTAVRTGYELPTHASVTRIIPAVRNGKIQLTETVQQTSAGTWLFGEVTEPVVLAFCGGAAQGWLGRLLAKHYIF